LPSIVGGGLLMQYSGNFVVDAAIPSPAATAAATTAATATPSLPTTAACTSTSTDSGTASRRVIVAGGTGMLGTALCRHLVSLNEAESGGDCCEVVVLSRRPARAKAVHGVTIAPWEGLPALLDYDGDVCVINLAGENPGVRRWTAEVKDAIAGSRMDAISKITAAIAAAHKKPRAFLQASAAGIYGDRGDELLDETSPVPTVSCHEREHESGRAFRIDVCKSIEEAADGVGIGTAVTHLRIGLLLGAGHGALPVLELAAAAGTRRFGSGDQWVSWVHVDDAAGAIATLAERPSGDPGAHSGIFNIAAPNATRNTDLMRSIASRRRSLIPAVFPIPASLLRAIDGEASCVVIDSARLVPSRLKLIGFEWKHPELDHALSSWGCNVPVVGALDLLRTYLKGRFGSSTSG
jgi:uncharacterized protein (TIGR01777 family)